MQQSHAYNDQSLALTTSILDAKARKNLSWQDLTDGTGLGLAYVTAALLGQHPLPEAAAKVVGEKLDLDADSIAVCKSSRCAAACRVYRPTRPFTVSTK